MASLAKSTATRDGYGCLCWTRLLRDNDGAGIGGIIDTAGVAIDGGIMIRWQ